MVSLAAVATICLATVACGGASSATSKPGAAAGAARAANANATLSACQATSAHAAAAAGAGTNADPLAGLSATKIESEALANFDAAPSVRWAGTLIDAGGNVMRSCVEYRLPRPCSEAGAIAGSCTMYQDDRDCSGTAWFGKKGSDAVLGSLTFIGVLTPHTYVSPSIGYWDSSVPAALRPKFPLVKGKYLPFGQLRPGAFSYALGNNLSAICDLLSVRTSLAGVEPVTRGAVTMLHGVRVVPLKESADTAYTVAYVTDTRKPEVVQSTWHLTNTSGAVTITKVISVGAPIDMTAPPPSEVVDPAKVGLPVVP